jgi:phage baseplate assembly protein W
MSNTNTRSSNIRPHLGSGWSFPVRPQGGRLCYVKYEEDIEQAIGIILETTSNERVMRPHFGGGLHSYLFEGNSSVTHQRIRESVRNALVDWEPRIDVENVSITASPTEPNLMFITIDYVVRRSNAFYNRVYPFYLSEAG